MDNHIGKPVVLYPKSSSRIEGNLASFNDELYKLGIEIPDCKENVEYEFSNLLKMFLYIPAVTDMEPKRCFVYQFFPISGHDKITLMRSSGFTMKEILNSQQGLEASNHSNQAVESEIQIMPRSQINHQSSVPMTEHQNVNMSGQDSQIDGQLAVVEEGVPQWSGIIFLGFDKDKNRLCYTRDKYEEVYFEYVRGDSVDSLLDMFPHVGELVYNPYIDFKSDALGLMRFYIVESEDTIVNRSDSIGA